MKKLMLLAAGLVASVFLAACATNGTGAAPRLIVPPQQLVSDFCPVVNADLKVISPRRRCSAQPSSNC
jgi:hypothetical protein